MHVQCACNAHAHARAHAHPGVRMYGDTCQSMLSISAYPPAVGVLDLSDEILRLRLCHLERRHQGCVTLGAAGGATPLDEGLAHGPGYGPGLLFRGTP